MSVPDYYRPNTIYCGDCRDVLRKFPEGCVELIYADPPFFSNRHYEVIWGDGYELRAFEDRWKGEVRSPLHMGLTMRQSTLNCQRYF